MFEAGILVLGSDDVACHKKHFGWPPLVCFLQDLNFIDMNTSMCEIERHRMLGMKVAKLKETGVMEVLPADIRDKFL